MTNRDRLVVMGLAALAVLGAMWFLAVAPARQQASKLGTEVETARQQLASAQSQVTEARKAQAQYATDYSSVLRLGKAVPPDQEVPSLVYQLDQASNQKAVDFSSITSGSSAPGASTSAPAAPARAAGAATGVVAGAATTGAVGAGFTQMPFTFVFNGSFFDLYHLFNKLNNFTLRTAAGGIQVTGRLLTIQSAKLDISQSAGAGQSSTGELTGTITATAYVLPASEGLTAGATPAGPAGATARPVSGSSGSPTTPAAVARVTP
jgi:hypothetical protein